MSKNVFFILILSLITMNVSCSSADVPNADANKNTSLTNTNQTNLPPEFKTEPVQPSGNQTPGIPDASNANKVPTGTTPTPGIQDPTKMTPVPKGATPTPGIPDEKTLRNQTKTLPMSSENPVIAPSSNSNAKQRVRKP